MNFLYIGMKVGLHILFTGRGLKIQISESFNMKEGCTELGSTIEKLSGNSKKNFFATIESCDSNSLRGCLVNE